MDFNWILIADELILTWSPIRFEWILIRIILSLIGAESDLNGCLLILY